MSEFIVTVNQLTFQYDIRNQKNILSDISFVVKKGEWLTIIGHNGSGKSTLAQLLVGLLVPQSGCIQIDGIDLNESTKWEIRERIGLVFQNPDNQFIGTTVQDDVAFGLENLNIPYPKMKERVDQALEVVEMTEFRLHDPSRLSGGQKQRVAIAGSLALQPDILILDEAFVMLDPLSRHHLLRILKDLQANTHLTIILITHNMDEAALSDRIIMMQEGVIAKEGSPRDIFENEYIVLPPFPEQLRRSLLNKGKNMPHTYMSEDEMVSWLCKSSLKM